MRIRATTVLLQLGLVAVALVVLPYRAFELDRYFVPKELVVNIVAVVALVFVLLRSRTTMIDTADMLLAAFLVWSIASAVFATNYWAAQRAVGVSVASAIVFWTTRRVGAMGLYRPILVAAGVATVCAALTALAQAYGMDLDYFSRNRAPGGTFGNRNFVAHFCAIGLPSLVFAIVTARTAFGALLGSIGFGVVAAALVLSRSRAGWLAIAVSSAVMLLPLLAARPYWGTLRVGRALARLAFAAAIGAGGAMFLPNSLNWNSDSPYLDSARGLVDYSSGSGRGRVTQYKNSLRMAAANPIFGVGPGNWPVRYVRFARPNDPSLASDGMTANPWPSSDWAAFVSERGLIGAVALLGVFTLLFLGGIRKWAALGSADPVFAKIVLVGTISATMVVSAFDAALLLAAPAFLAWAVIGATSGVGRGGREIHFSRGMWTAIVVVLLGVSGISLARSITQAIAISSVGNGGSRGGWLAGSDFDPGSYRINMRVAQMYADRGRCGQARFYARRARGLFPYSPGPRQILSRCG